MSSIITTNEQINMAHSIVNEWVGNANTYLGIGRVTAWDSGIIPQANNSTDALNDVWNRLFALVKLTAANFQLVIPRVDWVTGTIYSAYDNTIDMFTYSKYGAANGVVTTNTSNNVIVGTNTKFTLDFNPGNYIAYANTSNNSYEIKEVVSVNSNTSITVNSKPTFAVANIAGYNYSYTYPQFYNQFYVRNTYDQVYKCLFNNNGAMSTQMPQINLGGSLPSNPWIQTSDGYLWKYMYTIPSGLKQKFYTNQWMPVVDDPTVLASAQDGRIDVLQIVSPGTGYNGNVATSNAFIINITGDGTGANIAATVNSSGSITGYTIISGGYNYTYANVTVTTGASGSNANLRAVISPEGGHGSNSALELGATNMMLCVELPQTVGGIIPTGSSLTTAPVQYYQISVIQNPQLEATQKPATGTAYQTTTRISTGPLTAGYFFPIADTAYQGITASSATFTGTVVNWDSVNNIVYLNNIKGNFTPYSNFTSVLLGRNVTAFNISPPLIDPYTGVILYVQNRTAVSRSDQQTEQIKLVLEI